MKKIRQTVIITSTFCFSGVDNNNNNNNNKNNTIRKFKSYSSVKKIRETITITSTFHFSDVDKIDVEKSICNLNSSKNSQKHSNKMC